MDRRPLLLLVAALSGCLSIEPRGLPSLAWNAARPYVQHYAEPGSRSLPLMDEPLLTLGDLSISSSGHLRKVLPSAGDHTGHPGTDWRTSLRLEPDLLYLELKFRW